MQLQLINLDRAPERLACFRSRNPHLDDVERVSAVDGRLIRFGDLQAAKMIAPDLPYSDEATGQAVSHLLRWGACIKGNQPITLIEDDAVLCANFRAESERLLATLPPDWEMVVWGYDAGSAVLSDPTPDVPFDGAWSVPAGMRSDQALFPAGPVQAQLFRLTHSLGTVCYSVSPRGLARLLAFCVPLRPIRARHTGLGHALPSQNIGHLLTHLWPSMAVYASVPPLAMSERDWRRRPVPFLASDAAAAAHAARQGAEAARPVRAATRRTAIAVPVALQEADLLARIWVYAQEDGRILSRRLQLLPGGRLGGCRATGECRWAIQGGELALFDGFGRLTASFAPQANGGDGVAEMRSVVDGGVPLLLRTVEAAPGLRPQAVDPVRLVARARRRNLVILRADESSRHVQWDRDLADGDRNWDFCISYYGQPDSFERLDGCEYAVLQRDDRKYAAIHRLMHAASELWNYESFMFLDDDLQLSWSGINRCFEIAQEFGLQLAQPSLALDTEPAYISHEITRRVPGLMLRYTSFAEVMAPIFSREALRICLPSFVESWSSWGLDLVWPLMLGRPRHRIAVIDEVSMRHMRAGGGNYSTEDAANDMCDVIATHGGTCELEVFGFITMA